MKLEKFILTVLFFTTLAVLTSCEKDSDYIYEEESPISNVSMPIFVKDITLTTNYEAKFMVRFDNGGDIAENMYCTLYWRPYSKKPNEIPDHDDLYKCDNMRQYARTKKTTTFEETEVGLNEGTFIYYYFECTNSKGTTKTDVMRAIVKH